MAVFNGYPATYNPYLYSQYQQPQQQTSGIIWVSGEAGAKAYLVAPNTTVQLWDSERQTVYIKSADASGMPSMKVLDYTIRADNSPTFAPAAAHADGQYVTRAEFDALYGQINGLKSRIEKITEKKVDENV